jgi:hypothetical protein
MQFVVCNTYSEAELQRWLPGSPLIVSDASRIFVSEDRLVCFTMVRSVPSLVEQRVPGGLSYFTSPDYFCWLPEGVLASSRGQSDDAINLSSLFASHGNQVELFVDNDLSRNWHYVGTASVVGERGSKGITWKYIFKLCPRLSRDFWIGVGGYNEWVVRLGSKEYRISADEDVVALLRRDWGTVAPDIEITRYEGDSLTGVTNDRGMAVLCYRNDIGELHSRNANFSGSDDDWVTFPRSDGWDHEAPPSEVVVKADAIETIKTFLRTGKPTGLS